MHSGEDTMIYCLSMIGKFLCGWILTSLMLHYCGPTNHVDHPDLHTPTRSKRDQKRARSQEAHANGSANVD